MTNRIDRLLLGKDLTVAQTKSLFGQLFHNKKIPDEVKKQVLVLLQKKGEHSDELTGLVRLAGQSEKRMHPVGIPHLVDGCGTGGDGKHTFNISTIACLVAAGAGASVAKHGNRGISSRCGSSDLFESLGVKLDAPRDRMIRALRTCGIGYFHAPLYHPLFRRIQSLRQVLAKKRIRTIFNVIGPLLNPLEPRRQLIGVYRKDLVPVLAEAVGKLNYERALIIWNTGGFDELTPAAQSLLFELKDGHLKNRVLSPSTLGFRKSKARDLNGGSLNVNRRIALNLLTGKDTGPRLDTVLLNAAAILYVSGRADNFERGLKLARESIKSKTALRALKQLVQISHGTT